MTELLCKECDRPIATEEDFEQIPEDAGEHLCWVEYNGRCVHEPVDWRFRALSAERLVKASRHFEFDDGTDCKLTVDGWRTREYPETNARVHATLDEALQAIGKGRARGD